MGTSPFAEYSARLGRELATALVSVDDQDELAARVGEIAAKLTAASRAPESVEIADPVVNDTAFAHRDISPASSGRNPVAPPLSLTYEGEIAVGRAVLPLQYMGPPERVHGGVVAMLFDQTLGAASHAQGTPAFTRTLNITYDAGTPLNTPLEFRCWVDSSEGRKRFMKGELLAEGRVTARAEGLWVIPRDWETMFPEDAADFQNPAAQREPVAQA